ncbi:MULTISPECIES: hypothetical protein [unclassified Mycolicibacterium]|uniref:hypothetical protein n=1 Tax=unclassified Mycolicibacterium TaxID=2636767 RepID=UPI0012DD30D9|nr:MULTISPECIES: hypothetical protein [unclassified Mycolicibacterium]MUL84785.1 hypothetical protein [Mycolicibacterium sp. CBMA 329]MUL88561.1 hypothetical protein [Mycolicibacterium sp. CBMA 331]MUM00099.1 hypothetical protein [Mycolicibacterium sp. CBMA 334]MUM29164.1 hypothetical protein [Mycolicibacterium sp. CBMA 295]MUM40208.1 hypothetical protein [Mycolicibacterium sp. CBMA 247]
MGGPSERIVEQRVRNRIMEAVEILADGDDGVRAVGDCCYYNYFFDWIDDDMSTTWRELSTLSPTEVRELESLHNVLITSLQTTHAMNAEELIASGWPTRIAAVARTTLQTMQARGRYDEEIEEPDR